MSLPHLSLQVLLALLAALAAVSDLRTRTIPNWLTGGGFAAAVALQALSGGLEGLLAAAKGFGVAMAIYLPLNLLRAMGGGDLKLMAALGAAAGPGNWVAIFLLTSLLGLPIALVTVLVSGRLGKTVRNIGRILWQLVRFRLPHEADPELDVHHPRSFGLPHGAVIALGVAAFLALARV